MLSIHFKNKIYKFLSVVTLYAFVLQILIPSLAVASTGSVNAGYLPFTGSFLKGKAPKRMMDVTQAVSTQSQVETNCDMSVPTSLSASASGPGQNDNSGMSLSANDGLLNKFTGDMSYSIPLMDVEGFPITISYNPNISMDQEASWVGLGWDLSLGSINREMRGIPDDFSGDIVSRIFKGAPESISGSKSGVGIALGYGVPIGGLGGLNVSYNTQVLGGRYMNSYTGVGHTLNANAGWALSVYGVGINGGLGFSLDDQNGLGRSGSYGFTAVPTISGLSAAGYSYGKTKSSNSRDGMKSVSVTSGFTLGPKSSSFGWSTNRQKGSVQTFGIQTYVPRYQFNRRGFGNSFAYSFGLAGVYNSFFASLKYISISNTFLSMIASLDNSLPAYGYYNLSKSRNNTGAMLDFNRDGTNQVNSNSKHLGFTAVTEDMYYCNAPGLGSNYRAHRYEVFNLNDPTTGMNSRSDNTSSGFDVIGGLVGTAVIGGLDLSTGNGTTASIALTSGANKHPHFEFTNARETFDQREYYLKSVGEMTPVNEGLLNAYQGNEPVRLEIAESGGSIQLTGNIATDAGIFALPSDNKELIRPDNIIHYRELTGGERESYEIPIQSHQKFECDNREKEGLPGFDPVEPVSAFKPAHLISGVEVTNEGGMHYFFGVPSFNYQQKEVSFSASGLKNDADYMRTGMVQYAAGTDNSVSNSRGRQQMYDATTVPAYASAFLLTSMRSSDYTDRTGDGPTPDDQGNYYKINYTNVYGETNRFKWRMPMTGGNLSAEFDKRPNLASFQENLNTDPWDDMANYIYGEKDLWYGQSVESRNFIAYFCFDDRIDMYSAAGEDGGLDITKAGKLLKRIELYSRADLAKNRNAKPIQIVEFQYDYSLCPDYVGNKNSHAGFYGTNTGQGTGKLTLKRIFTYSGKSGEMKTMPVEFVYNTGEKNPEYAYNSSDRWGNYKPNNPAFPNHLLPYAEQDETAANEHIQAWKLKKIIQATGAELEFFFEADSYSYVQHEKAMRMFQVVGLSDTETLNELSEEANPGLAQLLGHGVSVFFRDPSEKKEYYDVVYFELDEPINLPDIADAHELVKQRYFTDAGGNIPNEFLFNMHVKLGRQSEDADVYETVQSMATLGKGLMGGSYIGVVGESGPFRYGYVVIQSDKINENNDHYYVTSLQKANWQFARLNAPYAIYGTPDYSAPNPLGFCDYSNSLDYRVLFNLDVNKKINRLEYGNKFLPSRSFIRLFEPDNVKIGGNAKLVSIQYTDGWNAMSGEAESSYRWNYDYSGGIPKGTSGVAAYEPKVGGDENPLYQMDAYTTDRFNLPDEKSYQFLPLAEILFPAPVVGYQQVSTEFGNTDISVAKSVGKNIDKYHTAKTYRTEVDHTRMRLIDKTGSNALKQGGVVKELQGYSEGFSVITNDFHGKPEGSEIYDAAGNLVSASYYTYYKPDTEKVKYMQKDGTVIESATPREIDIYTESWRNSNMTFSLDMTNTKSIGAFAPVPFPPFFLPYFFWSSDFNVMSTVSEVKGFTFEKVINHSAVLQSVTTYTLGSYNTTMNEIFDPHSGGVLLSSLKDEFNDKLYNFNYPAHWKYETFLNMNQTENAFFTDISGTGNIISVTSGLGLGLSVGDQLAVFTSGTYVADAWVLKIDGANVSLIDSDGEATTGIDWANSEIRVVSTGRKNLLTADMMSVTTKINPIPGSTFTFPASSVISSSASMFAENRNVPCTQLNGINTISAYTSGTENTTDYAIGEEINPFLNGIKGNYRPFSSFAFQDGRTNFEDPNGIRQNGTLKNYIPFYKYASGKWFGIDEAGHPNHVSGSLGSWRQMGQVNEYSEWGVATQSADQIRISQSGMTAVNRDLIPLQSASSINAQVHETGFDGFEIYKDSYGGPVNVTSTQFSLSKAFTPGTTLSTTEMHTGDYSMKVSGSSSVEFDTYVPVAQEENIEANEYLVRKCNCISNFAPVPGKEYLVSVWTKEESGTVPYAQTRLVIEYDDINGDPAGSQQIFTPSGAVIEGWQKIEGKYTIPANAAKVRIFFVNLDSGASYFDDFRTHPFLAGMTSIVYDAKTLLPLAEHDGYNYATFYNYDENYQLVRIKVETIEGIKTISETETGSKRTNH